MLELVDEACQPALPRAQRLPVMQLSLAGHAHAKAQLDQQFAPGQGRLALQAG